jgi:hypothetical protein
VPEATIFNAVAGEASRALGVPRVDVGRWHEDGTVSLLGSTSAPSLTSDHAFSRSGGCVARRVIATGHAARIDDWTTLPAPDAQTRLTDFTHLVASSISNVQARNSLIASRARIVTASDEIRRRIERNLHDGIQQRVVSVALSLRARSPSEPLSFPQATARVTVLNGARRSGVGGNLGPSSGGALSARTLNGVSQSSGSGTAERVRLEYTIVEVACRVACVVQAPSGFEVMPAR